MTRSETKSSRTDRAIGGSERRLVLLIGGVFALTTANHALGANAADALFFVRFGVDRLPLMILLSGIAVMVFLLIYTAGLAATGPTRWLGWTTAVCALLVLLEWGLALSDVSWVYPGIWIATQVIIWVTFTVAWNAAEASCDLRQAKRLFPIFATAGVAGGVIGNIATGPLASLVGTENLLAMQAALLAAAAFVLHRARHGFEDTSTAKVPIAGEISGPVGVIRSNRLLRLALAATFLVWTLFFLVIFPFNQEVASAFASESEVAGFLGTFASIVTGVTFLVSLLVTKRIFARWGIVLSLLLVPVVYAAGFGLWLVSFGLVTASIVRGLQAVTVNAVWSTGFPAVFNVLSGRRRGQVLAFMIAVPTQLGTVAGGAILLFGSELSNSVRFGLGLGLAALAAVVVVLMRPAYVSAIVAAVRQGLIGAFSMPTRGVSATVDGDAMRVLTAHLNDPRPGARALAATALAGFEGETKVDELEPLLADESPEVRSAAFDSMCVIAPERVGAYIATAISDPVPSVRVQTLRYMAGSDTAADLHLAVRAIEDPDPAVKAAAIVTVGGERARSAASTVLDSGDRHEVRALLEELARSGNPLRIDPKPWLTNPEPRTRAAAATMMDSSIATADLIGRLEDNSLRVRRAAAATLSASESGREALMDVLTVGSVHATDAALDALMAAGATVPELAQWAGDEARRTSFLQKAASSLEPVSSFDEGRYLVDILSSRAERLRGWVFKAMTTATNASDIAVIERGVRSDERETRSQAIEALDMLGDRAILGVLLPLLEGYETDEGESAEETLRLLIDDFDPWLSLLATQILERLSAGKDAGSGDEGDQVMPTWGTMEPGIDTLGRMDRLLALQKVPMFSELDPEDLDLIASATTEIRYGAGDNIYRRGVEGDSMMVIVNGSARVTRSADSGSSTLAEYGPGEHIGELSLLGGGPRTADVYAGDEGLLGVVLSKVELLSILEERPQVGLGMLATLAHRLVAQSMSPVDAGEDDSRGRDDTRH